mmetsp:Transcript_15235/g.47811  ORF Transcript_15235/g.47811 Transcript_15235/m.47811 type:complete len:391 (-) Transcript_15235:38-1210(-)
MLGEVPRTPVWKKDAIQPTRESAGRGRFAVDVRPRRARAEHEFGDAEPRRAHRLLRERAPEDGGRAADCLVRGRVLDAVLDGGDGRDGGGGERAVSLLSVVDGCEDAVHRRGHSRGGGRRRRAGRRRRQRPRLPAAAAARARAALVRMRSGRRPRLQAKRHPGLSGDDARVQLHRGRPAPRLSRLRRDQADRLPLGRREHVPPSPAPASPVLARPAAPGRRRPRLPHRRPRQARRRRRRRRRRRGHRLPPGPHGHARWGHQHLVQPLGRPRRCALLRPPPPRPRRLPDPHPPLLPPPHAHRPRRASPRRRQRHRQRHCHHLQGILPQHPGQSALARPPPLRLPRRSPSPDRDDPRAPGISLSLSPPSCPAILFLRRSLLASASGGVCPRS